MAKKGSDVRPIVKLRSTAGTGYTYVTKKNRRNDPDRLVRAVQRGYVTPWTATGAGR